ncbi:hypothetical protein RKD23_006865 [Streptomyces sp. SAI-170]|uniref:hypothetical protein n=1 Tax=Streptomyces sp. SAI-170 TaxID=3377729 RepID=UPI003C7B5A54
MSARHSVRSQNRLLFLATALVAVAALLRLMSPDGGTEPEQAPGPGPRSATAAPSERPADPGPTRSHRPSPDRSRTDPPPPEHRPDPATTTPKSGTSPSRSYPDPPQLPPVHHEPDRQ